MKRYITMMVAVIVWIVTLVGCDLNISLGGIAKGGTLYIQAHSQIAVTYNANGTVTAITAVTEDAKEIVAQYQDYSGKACADVVTELVAMIGEAGYLSGDAPISIGFDENSAMPSKDFAETVQQQIQTVVEENQWQSTVTVVPPVESTESTEPSGSGLPEGAVQQSDGTYLLTQYTDKSGNLVKEGDSAAEYIVRTVYDASFRMTSKIKEYSASGAPREDECWEYREDGTLAAYIRKYYHKSGSVQEHFRQDYDADGRVTLKTTYQNDGSVKNLVAYTYHSNGNIKSETETDEAGTLQATREYAENGNLLLHSTYYSDGTENTRTVCAEDGSSESFRWTKNGILEFWEALFSNGNLKAYKIWRGDGTLEREFTAFTDANNNNGIITQYDASGKPTHRSTEGNPDGSLPTMEMWDEEGIHYLFVMDQKMENTVEERYTYPDGGTLVITYDYETDRKHAIVQRSNYKSDLVSTISTEMPIEGYTETTNDIGIYIRLEWKDGYRYKEIQDGATNVYGYTYRETIYYYPDGKTKSAERYFYADGGRTYCEMDENGNTIYEEDTTKCDD